MQRGIRIESDESTDDDEPVNCEWVLGGDSKSKLLDDNEYAALSGALREQGDVVFAGGTLTVAVDRARETFFFVR